MKILSGDCVSVMSQMEHESIDSIVTDPPYHLTSIVKRFGPDGAAPAMSSAQRRFAETGGADRPPGTDQFGRLSKGFMGKTWDGGDVAFRPETWAAALRVLKPGGHLVAFGAPKNYHRLACAIEDAGFEIRDSLMWVFGSGFPKSLDVSKAIDKAAGAERPIVGRGENYGKSKLEDGKVGYGDYAGSWDITAPATPDAAEWQGWGTALKPAYEPIILARKPLVGTVATNVLAHGTGAINVDACRIEGDISEMEGRSGRSTPNNIYGAGINGGGVQEGTWAPNRAGRWPANLVHDGSGEVLAGFPDSKGAAGTVTGKEPSTGDRYVLSGLAGRHEPRVPRGDNGSAARFFASFPQEDQTWLDLSLLPGSASTAENSSLLPNETVASALVRAVNSALPEGLLCDPASTVLSMSATASGLKALVETATGAILSIGPRFWCASPPAKLSLTVDRASVAVVREPTGTTTITVSHWRSDGSADPVTFSITPLNSGLGAKDSARFLYHPKASAKDRAGSKHPTVKPIALMRWLVRLITPPGGTVLDPFAGSGTTGQAAAEEGFDAVLIEREAEYLADIRRRLGVMPSVEELLA